MSDKILKFDIKLNVFDIWLFSLYISNRAFYGVFNIIFSLTSLYVLISSYATLSTSKKILFILLASMFSIIQPGILYLKALKQSKMDRIKQGFLIELDLEKISISQNDTSIEFKWEEVYKTTFNSQMAIIYLSPLRAYLIPKRYFIENKQDLMNLLKTKSRISRF